MTTALTPDPHTGIIAWFARNHVAANLLMMLLILVGGVSLLVIKKEANPRFPVTNISINVPFPGASPEEVEQGVLLKLEVALKDVEGIETLDTYASEQGGSASIRVATNDGYEVEEVMGRVEQAVSTISQFPTETENPIITASRWQQSVMRVQIYGEMDERTRKALAEEVRDELLLLPDIAKAEVQGIRPTEIAIEVSERQLRRYKLTLNQIASAIRASSIDIPGGSIESGSGDIRIRAMGQVYRGREFENIVLITQQDGTRITVGDIATVRDEFVDIPFYGMYNGLPSASIEIQAVGQQSQTDVSNAAKRYVEEKAKTLPPGVNISAWGDVSVFIEQSVSLMVRNLAMGALMVFLVLSIFLRMKLAGWVMLGIPVSFFGTGMIMPMPGFDLTINMMSIFGFFVVLGIVVDDAIIVGESAFTEVEKKGQSIDNVIIGVKRVALPATFGVLTTIATFAPMVFSGGDFNASSRVIGLVVILCLLFSIVESKLILPAHLASINDAPPKWAITKAIYAMQDKVAAALQNFITHRYKPFLNFSIKHRYTTVVTFVSLLILVGGMFAGGIIRYVFAPEIPDMYAQAQIELAEGVPKELGLSISKQLRETLIQSAEEVNEEHNLDKSIVGDNMVFLLPNNNIFAVAEIIQNEDGDLDPEELTGRWRELMGEVAGTKTMRIRSKTRSGGGPAMEFKLTGQDSAKIEAAADQLIDYLRGFGGVYEVEGSHTAGPRELQLRIKPGAEALGLTQSSLATQVRQAFYGVEAQRVNRDRSEIRVMVRYPKDERTSVGNLESMWLRTPAGDEVPFDQVAVMEYDNAPARIFRQDGERVVIVSANIDSSVTSPSDVMADVYTGFSQVLKEQFPAVKLQRSGASQRETETVADFGKNFVISLFIIYALMAIPLKSYLQPLIVMSVIPFGLIGALLGHYILGYAVSSVTIMGLVALTGVVVNDGIILVDYVNKEVAAGTSRADAAVAAGTARFRAILLTSLTTFVGLTPMLAETSFQAAMMMPMAIALAFGILFATTMTLILIPCIYIITEDMRGWFRSKNVATEENSASTPAA